MPVAEVADALWRAATTRVPIDPVSDTWPELDPELAYRVQQHNRRRDLEAGELLIGHKIGLTSLAMQELLGVDEPDYGYLLGSMVHGDGVALESAAFLQPRAEPEIAFRLRRPLLGPGVTAADVLAATADVAPALEVVDSRIRDWRIGLADTIADNASSAAAVVGTWRPLADVPAPASIACSLRHRGAVVGTGVGSDVLGDPAAAVAWLANTLGRFGEALEPGQVLLSGSLTTAVFIHPGDTVTADFGPLGEVRLEVR